MKKYILLTSLLFLCLSGLKAQPWTLEKCLQYAKQHSRELLANQQELKLVAWDKKSSVAGLIPEIEGSAGIDHYWAIPVQVFPGELLGQAPGTYVPVKLGTPWMGNIGLQANLRLFDLKVWRKIKLSALQEQAARYKEQSLEKMLFKNIRMAYYQTNLLQKNFVLTQERYNNYNTIHDLLSLKFEKGQIDKITWNQSLTLLKSMQQAMSAASTDIRTSYMDLKYWMDYPLEDSLYIREEELWTILSDTVFISEKLPGYQHQKMNIRLARQQYQVAKAANYPSLIVESGYSKIGFGSSLNFINHSSWFASGYLGLRLKVPLLSFHKMFYEPKRQKTLLQMAELEFTRYTMEQKKHYYREKMLLREALSAVKTEEEKLEIAKENEGLSLLKIEKGMINMIELKQVQQDLNDTQESLNRARLELMQHVVELYYLQNE